MVGARVDLRRQKVFRQPLVHALAVWVFLFATAFWSAAYLWPALAEPVPVWTSFTRENSDLPNNRVPALTFGPDGSLWVGTYGGGLARLDKDGRWQTYSKASTTAACRAIASRRWRSARTAPSGPEPGGGLARLDKDGHWQTYSKASTMRRPTRRSRLGVGARPGRLPLGRNRRRPGAARQGRPLADLQQGQHQRRPAGRSRLGVGARPGRLALGWHLWRRPGAARQGRPLADLQPRPAPTAACRTMTSWRWRSARTARSGPEPRAALARLDKDGHWQTYRKASTTAACRTTHVRALALGADGALWAGTP